MTAVGWQCLSLLQAAYKIFTTLCSHCCGLHAAACSIQGRVKLQSVCAMLQIGLCRLLCFCH